ncbi:hypothetical protein J2792_004059 [Novosphingobium capsulatum]|uniref:Uncharacterized protein n=1 Tax=Novosphingobium capsulatum TaxID=13688 RepID=A0ABU1MSY8_9SPHN|nr:hypothetical protein [Novosphingobium capsulatum]
MPSLIVNRMAWSLSTIAPVDLFRTDTLIALLTDD